MKKLIISEGKEDTAFLKEIIEDYYNGWNINIFDIESKPKESRVNIESKEIRNFQQRWNPYEILLKSEGGKPNLMQVAPIIIKRYSTEDIDFDFLIDLDRDSVDDIISSINEPLRLNSAGRDVEARCIGEPTVNDWLRVQGVEVMSEDESVTQFDMICIDKELDDIVQIEEDSNDIDIEFNDEVHEDQIKTTITQALFD
jgi:hypothetical protein